MPFEKEFLIIDNEFYPNFNNIIGNIAFENNVIFLDYSKSSKWSFIDGHHLDENGAKLFSKKLSNDILEKLQEQEKIQKNPLHQSHILSNKPF